MRSGIGNPHMSKFEGACSFRFGPNNYVLSIHTDKQITRFKTRDRPQSQRCIVIALILEKVK